MIPFDSLSFRYCCPWVSLVLYSSLVCLVLLAFVSCMGLKITLHSRWFLCIGCLLACAWIHLNCLFMLHIWISHLCAESCLVFGWPIAVMCLFTCVMVLFAPHFSLLQVAWEPCWGWRTLFVKWCSHDMSAAAVLSMRLVITFLRFLHLLDAHYAFSCCPHPFKACCSVSLEQKC